MSLLNKKEFDTAIQNKNYELLWSAYESLRDELIIQRDLVLDITYLEEENEKLKKELSRIQRLPHLNKARASAIIMQVAAQLAKMSEANKAKQLKKAVDLWTVYTNRIEMERDKLKEELENSVDAF
jgi:hypothetical protein